MKTYRTGDSVAPTAWEVEADEEGLQISVEYPTEYGWGTKSLTIPAKDLKELLATEDNYSQIIKELQESRDKARKANELVKNLGVGKR